MILKKLFLGLAIIIVVVSAGGVAFALFQASAFNASIDKVYEIAPLPIHAVADPEVIARGKHIVESLGGCGECHGGDLGGKPGDEIGPIGSFSGANLTTGKGGVLGQYSDGQLARVIRHGLRANGKSLRFMPAQDIAWWPDDDLQALVSYLRTVPPVDRTPPETKVGLLGKVLDRLDFIPIDVARRIDHSAQRPKSLPAQVTPEYGALLAKSCTGCHGEHYSGGAIPGAPSNLPIPANITPHPTGLATATEADWNRLLDTGIKRDGKPLNPFMPIAMLRAMDANERAALWAFLKSLPPRPFGER